jgi:hypothetical protein
MDKKDLLALFHELRLFNTYIEEKAKENNETGAVGAATTTAATTATTVDLESIFENYDISKLDIRRIYRYLDKNVKKEAADDAILDDMDE